MADVYTLNFVKKSYEEIFLEMLIAAYDGGTGILSTDEYFLDYVAGDKDIENTIVMELSVHALLLSEGYDDLGLVYDAMDMYKAQGEDLDYLGTPFTPRRPASAAVTEATYGCDEPAESNVIIPLGHEVATEEETPTVFQTTEESVLLVGESSINVPVQCTQTGVVGNIAPGEIVDMVSDIIGIDSVTNTYGGYGGAEEESDFYYRSRLLNWKYTLGRGTYDAIREAITGVSAVAGYYIHQYWDGYGSTRIIIDPPLQTVIDSVTDAVNVVKAIDEDFSIIPVEELNIDVSVIVNVSIDETVPMPQSNMDRIGTMVEQCIGTYIDGGTNLDGSVRPPLGIGSDFIPFKAGVYISEQIPEIKDVSFSFPSSPVTVESHEKGVAGLISVTVV